MHAFRPLVARLQSRAKGPRLLLALMLAIGAGIGLHAAQASRHAKAPEVLDLPSAAGTFNRQATMSSVARHGDRLVAVGPRGVIALSTNDGKDWTPVASPVQADLVSVKFTDARTVWAVGHDAVALRSTDGGNTWRRMLDGRLLLTLMRSHYPQAGGNDAMAKLRAEVERWAGQSASPGVLPTPFLDVSFTDAQEGFLVGAFGLLLYTADGGEHWTPWMERAENERGFHLYAVGGHGGQRYIAGEQGTLLKLDRQAQRFVRIKTPYEGSFFGLDARPGRLIAFGLRGNAWLSPDEGQQWQKLATGIEAGLVAAVSLPDDRLVLISQAGHVLSVSADGRNAEPLQSPYVAEVLGAAPSGRASLVLALANGLRVVETVAQRP